MKIYVMEVRGKIYIQANSIDEADDKLYQGLKEMRFKKMPDDFFDIEYDTDSNEWEELEE